jgi:hypothetical protein
VPEAYFEGGWRMLDPDGQIYYLEDDGRSIAGVETLQQRPDLIRKYPSPYYTNAESLVRIYTSTDDNRIADSYRRQSSSSHTMAFILRPGESLARYHSSWGLYYTGMYRTGGQLVSRPKPRHMARMGNGRFVFEPVFQDDTFRRGAQEVRNLRGERSSERWLLTSGPDEGVIVYRFASPYPYLDGSVNITGHGSASLAFSETGETWQELWKSSSGEIKTTVPIGSHFRNRDAALPTYLFFLKLSRRSERCTGDRSQFWI